MDGQLIKWRNNWWRIWLVFVSKHTKSYLQFDEARYEWDQILYDPTRYWRQCLPASGPSLRLNLLSCKKKCTHINWVFSAVWILYCCLDFKFFSICPVFAQSAGIWEHCPLLICCPGHRRSSFTFQTFHPFPLALDVNQRGNHNDEAIRTHMIHKCLNSCCQPFTNQSTHSQLITLTKL